MSKLKMQNVAQYGSLHLGRARNAKLKPHMQRCNAAQETPQSFAATVGSSTGAIAQAERWLRKPTDDTYVLDPAVYRAKVRADLAKLQYGGRANSRWSLVNSAPKLTVTTQFSPCQSEGRRPCNVQYGGRVNVDGHL